MRKLLVTGILGAGLVAGLPAVAGPVSSATGIGPIDGGSVTLVHGLHRSCQLGKRGWHRHNDWGQRRPCRVWQGGGKRPDFCIRVGNFWYCDY